MTCGSCSASVEGVDHTVTVANDHDAAAEYTLLFGSPLRQGYIEGAGTDAASEPSVASHGNGRQGARGRHLEAGAVDAWAADGPIRFENTGDTPIRVERAGRTEEVPPGDVLTTSCPTERKRKTALGALAGGAVALGLGALRGR